MDNDVRAWAWRTGRGMLDDRHMLTSSRQFGVRGVRREFGGPLAGQVGPAPEVGQGEPGQERAEADGGLTDLRGGSNPPCRPRR
jgi:hypothetical protein